MKYIIDIISFSDNLHSLLSRYVDVSIAGLTCVKSFVEPVVDMIVKSENEPAHELLDMLTESLIPEALASRFAQREVHRLTRQLDNAITYYRHNHGCVVYALVISDAHCVVEIDNLHSRYCAPPRISDEDRYLTELRQTINDGGYVPERLRRLL